MLITLLTHETELNKPSNTGRLVSECMAELTGVRCFRVIWQRKQPDAGLLARLQTTRSGLLYPSVNAMPLPADGCGPVPLHMVLIDSTWQQARKIYNHSPYLHALPAFVLTGAQNSRFTLRRNQLAGGLCTLEAVAALAKIQQLPELAAKLEGVFEQLLSGNL